MAHITITNSGGSLNTEALGMSEDQDCSVAIQEVPMRTDGNVVNTGIRVLKSRLLRMKIRLDNGEKTTLNSIYNSKTEVTITSNHDGESKSWTFIGWFTAKPLTYELASDGVTTRLWITTIDFKIRTFNYA